MNLVDLEMEEEKGDKSVFEQGVKFEKKLLMESLKCIYNEKIRMLKWTWLYSKDISR